MKKVLGYICSFLFFFIVATIMFSSTAYAYLDPAATSYLVQIVAAVVIACGAVVGVFWKKIRMFFRNMKMKNLEKKLTREADKREAAEQEGKK